MNFKSMLKNKCIPISMINRNKIFFLIIITLTCFMPALLAQQITQIKSSPPISVELLLSNRGATFQNIISKDIRSIPRLGFFGVTNFVGEWQTNQVSDYMTQGSLTFELFKGLKLNAGFHLSNATGIRPSMGFIYSFANPVWLIVLNPRIDLSARANFESLALVEYKPRISTAFTLYSRIQLLYGETVNTSNHSRSYFFARTGLTYREFTAGIGTNIDYYGPNRQNQNSFGGFLAVQLL